MPFYYYQGAYSNGEKVTGTVEAPTQADAVVLIRQNCDTILSVREVHAQQKAKDFTPFKKVDPKALSIVCQQFSIILKAGLPLVQAVDLVSGQCQDKVLTKILKQASEDVSNGWSLSYSLQRRGKLPTAFVETIRSGEETGDMSGAFARMSEYYARMAKTKSSVSGAMIYPAFVLFAAVIVVIIIVTVAVPSMTSSFADMGTELPLPTRILIGMSDFMQKYILHLIVGAAAVALLIFLWGRTGSGHMTLSKLRLRLPVLGRIALMSGASQFAHTMSAMMAAGTPILQSLDVAGRSMSNYCMSHEILATIPGVESGKSLGECMNQAKHLPRMLIQMTTVGESTGSIESMLGIIAEYYDNEVDTATARALSMLEPIIIAFLAVIVVVLLLAIYLPIFTMENALI